MEVRAQALSPKDRWEDLERGFLIQALRDNNWNRQAAAQELGICRQTLSRKIKSLNIQPPKADGRSSRSKTHRYTEPGYPATRRIASLMIPQNAFFPDFFAF
jgi:hypothetical protein